MKRVLAISMVTLLVVGVIVAVVLLAYCDIIGLRDAIEIIVLIVLVSATFWYAFSTNHIAEISRRSLQLALDAEKNAVVPIIKSSRDSTSVSQLSGQRAEVHFTNIGRGPALNIRAWLTCETAGSETNERTAIKSADVIGVGEAGRFTWEQGSDTVWFPPSSNNFDVVIEYSDIYCRHFASRFSITNQHEHVFSFGWLSARSYPL